MGTSRSFEPFPNTVASPSSSSNAVSVSPVSSDTRMPDA
jgi:hypothetical protein